MKKRLAALCFELPRPDAGAALPRTLTLIPAPDADGRVRGVDGRGWLLPDPVALAAAFDRPRAITENHARVLVAPKGGQAPAFGWIHAVRADASGAIVFDPDWTPRGQAAIQNRDYLYLSPEFEYDDGGTIMAIVGAALTNDPNFPQLALNSEHDDPEHPMFKAIALALGLAETADEAACLTAINALKTERQTALNSAQHPDPTKYAPREELNVALNRATTAEAELATLQQAAREAEIANVLDEAQAAGKVIPATRELYLAMCRQSGLDQFRKLVAAMPVIAAPTQLDKKPELGAGAGAEGLTPHQLAICAAAGIAPKQYAESLRAAAA